MLNSQFFKIFLNSYLPCRKIEKLENSELLPNTLTDIWTFVNVEAQIFETVQMTSN